MLTKKDVVKYTRGLDKLANAVQANWREYGLTKKAAYDFCLKVDQVSDTLEKFSGRRRAEVLERDDDEDYLKYYDMGGVIDGGDADESWYMEHLDDDTNREFDYPSEGESKWELKNQPRSGFDVDAARYRRAEEDADDDLEEFDEDDLEAEASWYRRAEEDADDDLEEGLEEFDEDDLEAEASWYRRAEEEEDELDEDGLEAEASWYRRHRASARRSQGTPRTASSRRQVSRGASRTPSRRRRNDYWND